MSFSACEYVCRSLYACFSSVLLYPFVSMYISVSLSRSWVYHIYLCMSLCRQVFLAVCMYAWRSVSVFMHRSLWVCIYVWLSSYVSFRMNVYLSVCMCSISFGLYVCIYNGWGVSMSVCMYVSMSFCVCLTFCMRQSVPFSPRFLAFPIDVPICLSFCLSVYMHDNGWNWIATGSRLGGGEAKFVCTHMDRIILLLFRKKYAWPGSIVCKKEGNGRGRRREFFFNFNLVSFTLVIFFLILI